jgi:hypothetical protein
MVTPGESRQTIWESWLALRERNRSVNNLPVKTGRRIRTYTSCHDGCFEFPEWEVEQAMGPRFLPIMQNWHRAGSCSGKNLIQIMTIQRWNASEDRELTGFC